VGSAARLLRLAALVDHLHRFDTQAAGGGVAGNRRAVRPHIVSGAGRAGRARNGRGAVALYRRSRRRSRGRDGPGVDLAGDADALVDVCLSIGRKAVELE